MVTEFEVIRQKLVAAGWRDFSEIVTITSYNKDEMINPELRLKYVLNLGADVKKLQTNKACNKSLSIAIEILSINRNAICLIFNGEMIQTEMPSA